VVWTSAPSGSVPGTFSVRRTPTGQRLDIPVPPKYAGADFQKQSYWRHRGKLDVPKERFISYPGASPDSDTGSLLIGSAGWDHKDQATALLAASWRSCPGSDSGTAR
jgi:hypothetical protein